MIFYPLRQIFYAVFRGKGMKELYIVMRKKKLTPFIIVKLTLIPTVFDEKPL